MRRFWVDRSCFQGDQILLKDMLFHHICRVSQIRRGESFEVFAQGVQKYKVTLEEVSSSRAVAKIVKAYEVPPLPKPYLHLALSIPRFSKLDSIVEKAVELGVKEFHPFISELSFIKAASKWSSARQTRLEKIVENSLAVSGRTEALKLHPIKLLEDVNIPKDHRVLVAYEGGESSSKNIKEQLTSLDKQAPPTDIWLFVGSEGGFTLKEAQGLSQEGAFLVGLGSQILRVETACLVGLSILKYHYHS
ncbi:MAG: RsmE family RNA methyltransferase [Bdellovibrionales bacterium]